MPEDKTESDAALKRAYAAIAPQWPGAWREKVARARALAARQPCEADEPEEELPVVARGASYL